MTKKEARNLLNNSRPKGNNAYSIMLNEALDMAIQTLDQKPCEDAISRQVVINAIANTCFWLSADNWEELTKCIDSLPSVTPQQKIGHWIKEKSMCSWDGYSYQCSVCGRSIHLDIEVEDLEDYPYCHCGAKMESEAEEFDNLEEMLEKLWNEVEE